MDKIIRRKLTKDDLVRMKLPIRYWYASTDEIVDTKRINEKLTVKGKIIKYIHEIDFARKNGLGLLLWGKNGNGKTCIAAILAKEFRRRYNSVLFMECSKLKSFVINSGIIEH